MFVEVLYQAKKKANINGITLLSRAYTRQPNLAGPILKGKIVEELHKINVRKSWLKKVGYLFFAWASLGVREGSEVFFCWNTNADIIATASSGSRSFSWFSNKHSVHINSSPEFISQATRPLSCTTRSASIHPISFKTSICRDKTYMLINYYWAS